MEIQVLNDEDKKKLDQMSLKAKLEIEKVIKEEVIIADKDKEDIER